jgi:HlyD family secretion protein
MKKKKIIAALLLLVVIGGAAIFLINRIGRRAEPAHELTLYGNVEMRQVALPFNNTERIAALLVDEGDHVKRGQVLGRLDTNRLAPQVSGAEAQVSAQRQVVARLRHGARPEEIAQARATLQSATVEAADAKDRFDRLSRLRAGSVVSEQDFDSAKAAAQAAEARRMVSQKTLDLVVAGPRQEDIAEAEARLKGAEAQLALLQRQLADTELIAPIDAVVRTRILEPGEMSSPQKPVFTLAITEPKWVRTYVGEPDLGKVRPGQQVFVIVDSLPGRQIEGSIGFISSVAEFTPKTLETKELRTSLVYEVRVLVKDAADELRLGMPVTVRLPLVAAASR